MSDVIVSTTESTTDVTTTNDVTTVAITNTVVEISQATAGLQGVPGSNSDPTYVFVTNKTGAQLNKGSIVYVSGANGTHTQVSLALATGDVTSARTLGWLAEDIANNATGLCCVEGYLDGINTQGVTEGAQLYLSPTTPGAFTETKPSAPDHMVYVGFCSKASAGNGRVFVFVQNGAELEELHDVKIVSPQNNDLLRYVSGTALWENVASTAITVGSAITAGTSVYATNAGTSVYASTAGTSVYATNAGTAVDLSGSITKSQVSDFTSGTVASAGTAQQAGTAVYATTSGSASVAGSAVAYTGSITISQITDLANATVTSAATAQQAGTAVYALTSGTADYATTSGTSVYATTSGTAVTISGSITRSQVTDYASGTVATITGSITRSQVSNFSSGTVAYATSAGFASEADTANNATNAVSANTAVTSGTSVYATTSGTAVTISGTITNSQVSDFASGTVANISGTVTQAQVANLTTDLAGKANLAGGNSFTGAQTITGGGTANMVQITSTNSASFSLFRFTSSDATRFDFGKNDISNQSGSVFLFTPSAVPIEFSNGNTRRMVIENNGNVNIGGATNAGTATAKLTVFNTSASSVGQVVRGASGQTANLLELQNSGGTAVALVNPFGAASFGTNSILGRVTVSTGTTGTIGAVIRGAASQSANLQEWQDSAGSTAVSIASTGALTINTGNITAIQVNQNSGGRTLALGASGLINSSTFTNGTTAWAGVASGEFNTTVSTRVGIMIRGVASQTADLQQWQTSTGSTAALISSGGAFTTGGTAKLGQITAIPASTATVGVVVQGLSGQSANLQEWQTSTGTVRVRVTPSGEIVASNDAIRGVQLFSFNYLNQLNERNSGGELSMTRQTAVATNPGANIGRIYFRDGTNAGTLKLVVRAGAAGAETTILDNIPT